MKPVVAAAALAFAGLVVWLGLWAVPSAHASHEGYKYWMECSEEELYEPANHPNSSRTTTTQVRVSIFQTGHGPVLGDDGNPYMEGLVISVEHGTTSNDDFESLGIQTAAVQGVSGNDFETRAVLDDGDTAPLDADGVPELTGKTGEPVLDDDGRVVLTQVSTGEVIESSVAGAFWNILQDDITEHDETFTISFKRAALNEYGLVMTPHQLEENLSSYVRDINNPEYDNKCEFTVLDRDPVVTDITGYFTDDVTNTPPTSLGNGVSNNQCRGTHRFYVDWIDRYDNSGTWEQIDADRWDYHIHHPSNLTGVFDDARFNIRFGTRQAAVSSDRSGTQYGLEQNATFTVNYLTGTITGASASADGGAFHVRVRPRVDGVWQAYSAPMDFYCYPAGGV